MHILPKLFLCRWRRSVRRSPAIIALARPPPPPFMPLGTNRPTGQSKRRVRVVGTTLIVFDVADV